MKLHLLIIWYFLALKVSMDTVKAHSWLACSDYRGDVNYFEQENCFGWARRWEDRGSVLTVPRPNGYQIAVESNNSPRAFANNGCDRPMGSGSSLSWRDGYTDEFPHAIYEQGHVYCMAWSMQNHATTPEDCTNPQAKSDAAASDSLYFYISTVNPTSDPSQDDFYLRNINQVAGLAHSCDPQSHHYINEERCQLGLEKQQDARDCKGFQRSPAFCENTGEAMGTGCFLVPEDLPAGHYVGQWYWNTTFLRPTFRQETAYKTCFDFEVVEQSTATITFTDIPPGTKGISTSSLPCVNNMEVFEQVLQRSILPTSSPTSQNNNNDNNHNNNDNCSMVHQRCGGEGWNGPFCCIDGAECVEIYSGWPQCVSTNELPEQEPEPEPEQESNDEYMCAPLWNRCGGENWTGATCCQQGQCVEQHPNWFVCML